MFTEQELKGKKKDELVALCKEGGFAISGTKAVLISRLLGQAPPAPKTKAPATTKSASVARSQPACFSIISAKYIHARKNEQGNFEDPITHLVFDPETSAVVGKQAGADLIKLTIDDVAICREKGLRFVPELFDGNFMPKSEDIETTIERLIAEPEDGTAEGDEASEPEDEV